MFNTIQNLIILNYLTKYKREYLNEIVINMVAEIISATSSFKVCALHPVLFKWLD
jgi:hypothetical protein